MLGVAVRASLTSAVLLYYPSVETPPGGDTRSNLGMALKALVSLQRAKFVAGDAIRGTVQRTVCSGERARRDLRMRQTRNQHE